MTRLRSVVWALIRVSAVVLLLGWGALHLRTLDHNLGLKLPSWTLLVGILLMTVGAWLVLLCAGMLSTRGIFDTRGDRFFPKEFVAFGPFRYLRNPMSAGVVVLTIGFGLYHRSVSILVLSLVLFVILHLVVVLVEEPGLEKRFGHTYREYKSSVNRWLPRFPRSRRLTSA